MKIKVSISIEEQTLQDVERKIKGGMYRNKSHFIEYAVNRLLRKE